MSNLRKANWIARQLPEVSEDEIYDVLLGNINQPSDLVKEVMELAAEYDALQREYNDKIRMD